MALRLVKYTAALFCVLAVIVFAVTLSIVEDTPVVVAKDNPHLNNAESVNALLKQLKSVNRRRFFQQTILLTGEQLNSMAGLVQRALPAFSGKVELIKGQSVVYASYELPRNPFGKFINVRVNVRSAEGLDIESFDIGRFSVSGEIGLKVLSKALDWYVGGEIGSQLLAQFKRISVGQKHMVVTLHPLDAFLKQLNTLKNGLNVEQDDELREATAHYLEFLWRLPVDRDNVNLSLQQYISPLFTEASRRSADLPHVKENQAALLALAIYTGHHRLANLVGDVQPIVGKAALPKHRPTLAGRKDLTQHFVISAALHVLAERGVSSAIGEFKELMDRGLGGSGYSFVDLAADLTGVQVAVLALDPRYAATVQRLIANSESETAFFPDVSALPEGLDKRTFSAQYGDVDSQAYRAEVEKIEKRIAELPLMAATLKGSVVMVSPE